MPPKDRTPPTIWQPPRGTAGPPPKVYVLDTPLVRNLAKGRRRPIPTMTVDAWRKLYDQWHMLHLILLHNKHLTKVESLTLIALVRLEKVGIRATMTEVQKELSQSSPRRVSIAIGDLGLCRLVVNIGSAKVPQLVPQPTIGLWDLARLAELHSRKFAEFEPTRHPV